MRVTWHPQFRPDEDGGLYEDIPAVIYLGGGFEAVSASVNDAAWESLARAMLSPLFETPVHFLVRAFSSDGIDEFIAHMLTIEAALGLRSDYGKEKQVLPKLNGPKRIECRISALLNSPADGALYDWLFDLRSVFLHGRQMTAIGAEYRLQAGSLARRVARAVLERAVAGGELAKSCEDFATNLLVQGGGKVARQEKGVERGRPTPRNSENSPISGAFHATRLGQSRETVTNATATTAGSTNATSGLTPAVLRTAKAPKIADMA